MRAVSSTSLSAVVALMASACGSQDAHVQPADQGAAEATVGEATPAEALLARSIAFHDPQGVWSSFRGSLEFEEIRPDGASRMATVGLDVATSAFRYAADMDGERVVKEVTGDGCRATVDDEEPSPEHIEGHRLGCDQIERSRNYYLYLWGLPMKLRDPGTHVDPEVVATEFEGLPVQQLRVTYDADVGGDTWYFYFEPESARMVGYRFYHDESANDGEYITLEGEHVVNSLRLPARRRWFVNSDDRFLGEDVLVGSGTF